MIFFVVISFGLPFIWQVCSLGLLAISHEEEKQTAAEKVTVDQNFRSSTELQEENNSRGMDFLNALRVRMYLLKSGHM